MARSIAALREGLSSLGGGEREVLREGGKKKKRTSGKSTISSKECEWVG